MTAERSLIVSRLLAAFNARDIDAWMADSTEDLDLESRFSSVAGSLYHGRDGVLAWWRDLAEAWDPIKVELEGTGEIGPDGIAVLMIIHGKGRESGLELHESVALRWHLRGDRLVRMRYMDRQEAELIVGRHG